MDVLSKLGCVKIPQVLALLIVRDRGIQYTERTCSEPSDGQIKLLLIVGVTGVGGSRFIAVTYNITRIRMCDLVQCGVSEASKLVRI